MSESENNPDIVLVFDHNLNYITGAKGALADIGVDTDNIQGAGIFKIFENVTDKKWVFDADRRIRDAFLNNKTVSYVERVRFKTYEYLYYETRAIPFNGGAGKNTGVIFIMRNITEYNFTAETANVLVVDDININLTVVEVQLNEYGISPLLASNGKRAVDAVKVNDFDIIFMDYMMPVMDGIEAAAQIRKMGGKYELIPIIALTANEAGGVKEQLLKNGFNDFLAKPVAPEVLKRVLLKWLPPEKVKRI